MDLDKDYSDLLEMRPEQLQRLKDECAATIDEVKTKILDEYRIVKPALERMKQHKTRIREVRDRIELIDMFMSLDRSSFALLTNDSIEAARKSKPTPQKTMHSLEKLMKTVLDEEQLQDSPPALPRRGRSRTPKRVQFT